MKERTIKELLVLLKKYLPGNIKYRNKGSLCYAIIEMFYEDLINADELRSLDDYISLNKPDDAGDYALPDKLHVNGFWWPYNELKPRIKFLNKLISKL